MSPPEAQQVSMIKYFSDEVLLSHFYTLYNDVYQHLDIYEDLYTLVSRYFPNDQCV